MNNKKNIDRLVDETLESVSSIDAVKAPPFFKDKVLNRMAQKDPIAEEGVRYLNWFKPQLQAAALICFVFLNAYVLFNNVADNTEANYGENVENFAEVYGLSETDTNSYFYQN